MAEVTTPPPDDPQITAGLLLLAGCSNSLRERVTFTIGLARPIPDSPTRLRPEFPAPLDGELDLSTVPLGFLQDFLSIVGNAADETDGFDSILAEALDAAATVDGILSGLDSPLGIFSGVLDFLGTPIPADVAADHAAALAGGSSALSSMGTNLTAYAPSEVTLTPVPPPPVGTLPTGGGGGGGEGGDGGGGGGGVSCIDVGVEMLCHLFVT